MIRTLPAATSAEILGWILEEVEDGAPMPLNIAFQPAHLFAELRVEPNAPLVVDDWMERLVCRHPAAIRMTVQGKPLHSNDRDWCPYEGSGRLRGWRIGFVSYIDWPVAESAAPELVPA